MIVVMMLLIRVSLTCPMVPMFAGMAVADFSPKPRMLVNSAVAMFAVCLVIFLSFQLKFGIKDIQFLHLLYQPIRHLNPHA